MPSPHLVAALRGTALVGLLLCMMIKKCKFPPQALLLWQRPADCIHS
jgi:hypothetical protein